MFKELPDILTNRVKGNSPCIYVVVNKKPWSDERETFQGEPGHGDGQFVNIFDTVII